MARAPAPGSVTDAEFALFQALIHREAGIYLVPAKKPLLEARLARRLRDLRLHSFGAYYRHVVEGDGKELVRLLDCICTNETHFFREPQHFEFVRSRVIPEWVAAASAGLRPRHICVWSAACSTGEEPYSLAMTFLAQLPSGAGWDFEILATDLSTRALERAQEAVWPLGKAGDIPSEYLRRFMRKGIRTQDGKMKAGPEIRARIRFQRLNLSEEAYPVTGPFDLIFCRNVLIYFTAEMRARVVHRLRRHLAPTGYLFLGHAETLSGLAEEFCSIIPTVYAPARDPQRGCETPAASLASPAPQQAGRGA